MRRHAYAAGATRLSSIQRALSISGTARDARRPRSKDARATTAPLPIFFTMIALPG